MDKKKIQELFGEFVSESKPKAENKRLKGAVFQHGVWRGQISIFGKTTHLGNFKTEEEAHEAYVKAKKHLDGLKAKAAEKYKFEKELEKARKQL